MIELISQRLAAYSASDALEEEQALKEILQEVTLYLLWRGAFSMRQRFNWYVKQQVQPNLPLLQAALRQYGPWRDQDIAVTPSWMGERLQEKIASIDWAMAADDVRRFLGKAERESLKLWSQKFFSAKVAQLNRPHE